MARPIGFRATFAYLQQKVDQPWRSLQFLIPAITLLESERSEEARLQAIHSSYRRRIKAAGERFARPEVVTPRSPLRWHGDESNAARYALEAWLAHRNVADLARHPDGRVALCAANAVLTSTDQPSDLAALQEILERARRRMNMGSQSNRSEYTVAFHTVFLLGQVHVRAFGRPAINAPWNFTDRS